MFGLSTTELILIVVVILLLFGAGRIPAALGGLGKGIREFKKGMKNEDDASPQVAEQVRPGVGKHVRLLADGTLEIGVTEGATLVEVDTSYLTLREGEGTDRIPLVQVKRVVYIR